MNTNASELCVLSSLAGLHPKLTDETSATAVCCSQSCLTRRPCHQNMPVDEEPGQLRRVATPRLVCYQYPDLRNETLSCGMARSPLRSRSSARNTLRLR
ncbi:hypothetical protein KOW79_017731 [Hemibagrus wyckioides]|uniref:Uncharacterized protein n=1 Tax=Hemibagrus wyckioides TaxID=337641 RepID=A0A9D3NBN4_9TELE|nr:hypothetical protein KOW79_017731 [Hemibagrus wyckioides]